MRIAQAAALTGLSPRQIRYYAERGVLPEAGRSPGQHREFTDQDVRRLTTLRALLAAGVPPELAARAIDGRLTPTERIRVDGLLDRQAAAQHQTRLLLADATAGPVAQPDISLMFDIYVLRSRMGAALTGALADAGLSATEYALFSLVDEAPAMTATELARLVGVAPPALGRQLAELVRRGWVSREPDPGDRRRTTFCLTPDGDQRFRAAIPLAVRVAAELDRGLRERGTAPGDARSMLQTLSAVLRSLAPAP